MRVGRSGRPSTRGSIATSIPGRAIVVQRGGRDRAIRRCPLRRTPSGALPRSRSRRRTRR
ncbi:hypothetical protein ACFFX0_09235 [Citricoccus parietis]|uniref:Uncharacterized protein n=1 Tax=Citricoccus parietis TaxID=592307 RepID=A0ABV5FYQ1_9MICC